MLLDGSLNYFRKAVSVLIYINTQKGTGFSMEFLTKKCFSTSVVKFSCILALYIVLKTLTAYCFS